MEAWAGAKKNDGASIDEAADEVPVIPKFLRACLVDWLASVVDNYMKVDDHSVMFTAVSLLDRYYSKGISVPGH